MSARAITAEKKGRGTTAGRAATAGRVGFVQVMDCYADVDRNATQWLRERGLYAGRGMVRMTVVDEPAAVEGGAEPWQP